MQIWFRSTSTIRLSNCLSVAEGTSGRRYHIQHAEDWIWFMNRIAWSACSSKFVYYVPDSTHCWMCTRNGGLVLKLVPPDFIRFCSGAKSGLVLSTPESKMKSVKSNQSGTDIKFEILASLTILGLLWKSLGNRFHRLENLPNFGTFVIPSER